MNDWREPTKMAMPSGTVEEFVAAFRKRMAEVEPDVAQRFADWHFDAEFVPEVASQAEAAKLFTAALRAECDALRAGAALVVPAGGVGG